MFREYSFKLLFPYIFFLYIKLQERLIKIQLNQVNKSFLKFRHASALSELKNYQSP